MGKETKKEHDQWADIRHFKPRDFACGCDRCRAGGLPKINMDLVLALDYMANELSRPLVIQKGLSCNSPLHGAGNAVDVATPDSAFRYAVVKAAQEYGVNRIGLGIQGYVHLEMAPDTEPGLWVEHGANRA